MWHTCARACEHTAASWHLWLLCAEQDGKWMVETELGLAMLSTARVMLLACVERAGCDGMGVSAARRIECGRDPGI